ncbi:protease inhibitor I42 family protein [Streptomyces canus]|uniref:protease inhibitor I42 family protein n=1 Tax=Streptomyces canus TaxID=58343 RepID=UPI0030E07BE9
MAEVWVTPQNSEIHVSPGDEVVVRLPQNATTGYLWSVQRVDGIAEVIGNEYEVSGQPLPGAGGQQVVRIRAAAAGEGLVRLVLKRPWESAVQDRCDVRISVGAEEPGPGRGPQRPGPPPTRDGPGEGGTSAHHR